MKTTNFTRHRYEKRSRCDLTLQKFIRKVKRAINVYFFTECAEKSLQQRSGRCLQCGRCCKLVFRCPFLKVDEHSIRCLIYKHRFKVCRLFPITKEDLEDVNYQCGYSFVETDLQVYPLGRPWVCNCR